MFQLNNVTKHYQQFVAINNVTLNIQAGSIHGIIGASGAGKSTLLRMMNLLEKPNAGSVLFEGNDLTKMSPKTLRNARKQIGMIFQHFHLIQNKTVFENVEVALKLANYPKKDIASRVRECLKFVGLDSLEAQYPGQLSGGQKQRVAIARALANEPRVLLCDEPTSALDPHTSDEILTVLQKINEQYGVTVVLVSHEMDVIKSVCTNVTVLERGEVYKSLSLMPLGIKTSSSSAERFVQALIGGASNDS